MSIVQQIRGGIRSIGWWLVGSNDSLVSAMKQYGPIGGFRRWAGLAYLTYTTDIEGESIFNSDWDICIILDACRADELERFSGRYEWLDSVGRFPSLASCTWDWVPETVAATPDDTLNETLYVSANPFVGELTERPVFRDVDKVYEHSWDSDIGSVWPASVTDTAISRWRTDQPERMVVHYIQPHVPFLTEDASSIGKHNFDTDQDSDIDAWDKVTSGTLGRDVAIERYRDNLEQALDSVDLLLSSVDATDVIVTADHGEAFGEMGVYGHPSGIGLPCLVDVPWVDTTATAENDYEPERDPVDEETVSTEEQLQALGYAE